ncbi:hypothetical protein ACFUTV_41225 [Streptomyces sp. NPDC057298]|uniref:hypothetical protein n=1 Tax=Streptomyces sp. NPDC057298 TaxID=3346091 RepID=UPI003642C76C
MTDNNESPYPPEQLGDEPAVSATGPVAEAVQRTSEAGNTGNGGAGQGEMAGLVLLINTVLGGLGTLCVTTKSAVITLSSALLVLLIILVVLIVKRVVARGDRTEGKAEPGGE